MKTHAWKIGDRLVTIAQVENVAFDIVPLGSFGTITAINDCPTTHAYVLFDCGFSCYVNTENARSYPGKFRPAWMPRKRTLVL
jgi:hypothetical protein